MGFGFDTYAPAVTSWGKNRLDVFFVDSTGHLQQKWYNGAWQPLNPVGGSNFLSGSPSAVAWKSQSGAQRLDVFVRGENYDLWQKYWQGSWSGWYDLGQLYDEWHVFSQPKR